MQNGARKLVTEKIRASDGEAGGGDAGARIEGRDLGLPRVARGGEGVAPQEPDPLEVPASQVLAPRRLSPDQRYVLKSLVEKEGSVRSAAVFALGYWAGCRVSDVSWLRTQDCHLGLKVGWLRVGHKGGKTRDVDLLNQARRPMFEYLRNAAAANDDNLVVVHQILLPGTSKSDSASTAFCGL